MFKKKNDGKYKKEQQKIQHYFRPYYYYNYLHFASIVSRLHAHRNTIGTNLNT